MQRDLPIIIRERRDEDTPYIFNTWKKSYQHEPIHMGISNNIYWDMMNKRCDKLDKISKTMVAVAEFDDNFIVGWIMFNESAMHYAFTKGPYRKMGVFRRLRNVTDLPVPTPCTHWTRWLEKKAINNNLFTFCPAMGMIG